MGRQTDLQKSIHGPHWDTRQRIITALDSLPDPKAAKRAIRLAQCGTSAAISISPHTNEVHPYVNRCGSRLCPFCGRYRTAELAIRIRGLIVTMKAPKHIVLTVVSSPRPLSEQLHHLKNSFRRLRATPEWKRIVAGGVAALEVTLNCQTGLWHPHLHIIADSGYFPVQRLATLWAQWNPGARNQWIKPVDNAWEAAKEAAKYVSKPPNMYDWPNAKVAEYVQEIYRHRMVNTFGTYHNQKVQAPEEQPVPGVDGWHTTLPQLTWLASQGNAAAADILSLAYAAWPMFRTYISRHAPKLVDAQTSRTWPGTPLPRAARDPAGISTAVTDKTQQAILRDMLYSLMVTLRDQIAPRGP